MIRVPRGYEDFPIGNPFPVDGDRRRYDPVTATVAAVGAGTQLFSGISGRNSANTQAARLEAAARSAGEQVVNTTNEQNTNLRNTTTQQNQNLLNVLQPVNENINTATAGAVAGRNDATTRANLLLNPYIESGAQANSQLQAGLVPGGDFNRNFTINDINSQIDPGLDYRVATGIKERQQLAAANGSLNSGGAQKAFETFRQNERSNEFSKAFDRYRTTNQDRYDRLFGVSKQGQTAATEAGGNLISGSEYTGNRNIDAAIRTGQNTLDVNTTTTGREIGTETTAGNRNIDAESTRQNYLTDAASAAAQARFQGTQLLNQGITGAGQQVGGALQLRQALRNPGSRVNYLSQAPVAGNYGGRTPPFVAPTTSIPANGGFR